jgi:hypothetical protein
MQNGEEVILELLGTRRVRCVSAGLMLAAMTLEGSIRVVQWKMLFIVPR